MTRISNTRIIRAKVVGQGEDFSEENFKIETTELDATLNDGEILVRNLYISLDPCKSVAIQLLYIVILRVPCPQSRPGLTALFYYASMIRCPNGV